MTAVQKGAQRQSRWYWIWRVDSGTDEALQRFLAGDQSRWATAWHAGTSVW